MPGEGCALHSRYACGPPRQGNIYRLDNSSMQTRMQPPSGVDKAKLRGDFASALRCGLTGSATAKHGRWCDTETPATSLTKRIYYESLD
jgi:hypothetical protein